MPFASFQDTLLAAFFRLPHPQEAEQNGGQNHDHDDQDDKLEYLARSDLSFIYRSGFQIVVGASAAHVALSRL